MGHTFFDDDGNPKENPGVLHAKTGETKVNEPRKPWVDAVKKIIPEMDTRRFNHINPEVSIDGNSAYISLPKEFLIQSRKRWNSSCIGHFVGGGFSFKFVKERTMKLWGNCGWSNVLYSSKGYYTFEFESEKDMQKSLGMNSFNIGGKRLYLTPWIDGSQFQKNVIPNVTVWIKLIDVPNSYWSWVGLGSIAKVMGKPLTLDAQTASLHPMKYAGVLVDLRYRSCYPKYVWVPVINDIDVSIVKVRVDVEYSALPQSCSYCAAFGHSLARCSFKPQKAADSASDVLDKITTVVNGYVPVKEHIPSPVADSGSPASQPIDQDVQPELSPNSAQPALCPVRARAQPEC